MGDITKLYATKQDHNEKHQIIVLEKSDFYKH